MNTREYILRLDQWVLLIAERMHMSVSEVLDMEVDAFGVVMNVIRAEFEAERRRAKATRPILVM